MENNFEISLGDVTDMEAHVLARFVGSDNVELTGTLRGPFCERAKTLPADFPFRKTNSEQSATVEALVTEPCLWSLEMPLLYQVELQAAHGEQIIAEYHGTIGLERLAPRRPVDFAPGTG